jgi:hypothetical protein
MGMAEGTGDADGYREHARQGQKRSPTHVRANVAAFGALHDDVLAAQPAAGTEHGRDVRVGKTVCLWHRGGGFGGGAACPRYDFDSD